MNNFFAICKSNNSYTFRNTEILGKKPFEIILSRLSGLDIQESFANPETLLGIMDWAVSKRGTLLIADERALLLDKDDYSNMLKSCNSKNPFIVAFNSLKMEPCAIACDIDALILCMSKFDIGADDISRLYHMLLANKVSIEYCELSSENSTMLNSGKDYPIVLKKLSSEINAQHMDKGVLFISPDSCYIDFSVNIGYGATIYPGNIIKGDSNIAADCILYPNNRITNASIGRATTIESSVLIDCSIGKNTTVGPFAYIRPGSNIKDNCRIGDFVEIKNSNIDDNTKISHLTYVGDSDLGKNINLGCGVVFVNYDGKIKQRSKIEDNAFIGCNTNIIAPVTVEENAYVAAGSTITENVPKDSLHISRSRAVIKENWAKKRREDGRLN